MELLRVCVDGNFFSSIFWDSITAKLINSFCVEVFHRVFIIKLLSLRETNFFRDVNLLELVISINHLCFDVQNVFW
jgi:hypothetical protein